MDWDPMKAASAWDFTKLEIQDGPTDLPPSDAHLANNEDGITSTAAVQSGGLFSVDLKLGRVMDDYDHMISSSSTSTMDADAAIMSSSSSSTSTAAAAGGLMHHQGLTMSMSRRSSRGGVDGAVPVYSCLVDGCTWDLSGCREYHRRHRVCERHSKTPVVLVRGEEQRFCQQCSRFHPLREFDEAKRSCRKRLDGHNRRRRKKQRDTTGEYPTTTTAAHSNSNSNTVINTSLLTTATQSPGSALMEFIRNAPPLPWPMAAPLPPHDRPQEGFFFPTSPAAASFYPLITPGFVGGFEDQSQIIRSTHHNYTDNNNNHNIMDHDEDEDDDHHHHHHQSSIICHHHHQPQVINTNIDCALSLLSSAAATAPMDDHPHHHQELDDHVGNGTTTTTAAAAAAAAAIVNGSYGSALFHHHQQHQAGGQRFDPNNEADGSSSRVFHFDNNWD